MDKRTAESIREHVVDVSVPQVVGQLFVVPKISSQDRVLQCTVEQVSRCSGDADRGTVGGCADIVFQDRTSSARTWRSLTSQLRR